MAQSRRAVGTVFQRSDGRWVAQVDAGFRGGKRYRPSKYRKTQAEAERALGELQRTVDAALPVPDERQTVAQFLNRWLADTIDTSDRKPATQASYRYICKRYVIPSLGRHRLAKLGPRDVQSFLNEMAPNYSARTVQYSLAVLRAALAQAERWGEVSRNVAKLVEQPACRKRDATERALSAADMRKLLTAARRDRLYALIVVMGTCGLRKGEALALQWCDIDLETASEGRLTVCRNVQRVQGRGLVFGTPKGKTASAELALSPKVVAVLREHRLRQLQERMTAGPEWSENGLVFPSTRGTVMEPRNLNRHFDRLVTRAGLPKHVVHDLRHTAATLVLSSGYDAKVAQQLLRHSRLATTADTYLHVADAMQRDVATRVADELFA